jgi:hypothetical protein
MGSSNQGVRSIAGHSTGKYFVSLVIGAVSNNMLFGISTSAYSLTSGGLLSGTNGLGTVNGGSIIFNGGSIGGGSAYVAGDKFPRTERTAAILG